MDPPLIAMEGSHRMPPPTVDFDSYESSSPEKMRATHHQSIELQQHGGNRRNTRNRSGSAPRRKSSRGIGGNTGRSGAGPGDPVTVSEVKKSKSPSFFG